MKPLRSILTVLALATCASPLRAVVVPILSDTVGAVRLGATTLSKTSGAAKTLAISPKSTAFIRFATGDTGILPSEVGAARLTIYFASVTKPGSVSFHNITEAFTESFPEKTKPAPAIAAAFASVTAVKGQYITLDVTAEVITWLTTPTPGGFGIAVTADGTTATVLASKEGAGSGHPAVLEIDLASSAVATAVDLANAATSANTAGTIMRRDGSGNVTVGTITGNLAGNATTATTAESATNFTGALAGDVAGTQDATVVANVGGVTAANVAAGANLANAATTANTPNTIVKRDASGNIPASGVATAPPGMVLIPAGPFTMGNSVVEDTDITGAAPASTTVSAFYMDMNEVTLSQWQSVQQWGTLVGGYTDLPAGSGKGATHPVQGGNWYAVVKWCNARSEREGKTPVYYTDDAQTTVYRTGNVNVTNVQVKWTANGYRLPTEAMWEKAAGGGLAGKRFPCGDTISQKQANYIGSTASYAYDLGPNGYNAIGSVGGTATATSPVGSFAANGFGLNDMAGNVWEWCWDWYGTPYAGGTDPKGAASGSFRVIRGGSWDRDASYARCANRFYISPTGSFSSVGFRAVLPLGQP